MFNVAYEEGGKELLEMKNKLVFKKIYTINVALFFKYFIKNYTIEK